MTSRKPSGLTIALLTLAVVGLIVLRNDFWNWHVVNPIAFLPIGLWWQILVTLGSSLVMWLLVTFAWPSHLEQETYEAERTRTKTEEPQIHADERG